ncbi:hypothetical protein IWZ03DRAFT_363683 [Phyllosticta citriasiana]|uniref:DUF2075 domain-containing protein n=1 Tax=Phyllosticta citriasiana TaxID=595635 RepID=A0ABR1KAN2_9PEZI
MDAPLECGVAEVQYFDGRMAMDLEPAPNFQYFSCRIRPVNLGTWPLYTSVSHSVMRSKQGGAKLLLAPPNLSNSPILREYQLLIFDESQRVARHSQERCWRPAGLDLMACAAPRRTTDPAESISPIINIADDALSTPRVPHDLDARGSSALCEHATPMRYDTYHGDAWMAWSVDVPLHERSTNISTLETMYVTMRAAAPQQCGFEHARRRRTTKYSKYSPHYALV